MQHFQHPCWFYGARKVINSAAVGSYVAGKVPLVAQNIIHQQVVTAAWLAFESIIGAHYARNFRVYHQVVKSGQVRIPKVIIANLGIKFMPRRFGAAVDSIMFGAGGSFKIFGIVTPANR